MRALVFDTSAVISISANNLLEVLFALKQHFQGEFFISPAVKRELIDNPLHTRRFELQAVLLADFIAKGSLKFLQHLAVEHKAAELTDVINRIFSINGKPLSIVDPAEVEGLVLAKMLKAEAYVIDERTLRLLVEDYHNLVRLFERKFGMRVGVDKSALHGFQDFLGDVHILRSAELMTVAFELGLFHGYLDGKQLIRDYEKKMLEGILWGLRLRGCAISTREIEDVLKLERFNK